MNVPQQTESPQPTPEQLLRMLDMQMTQERTKRAGKTRNRGIFLVVGLVFIFVAACAALMVAQNMLMDLKNPDPANMSMTATDPAR